MIWVTQIFFAFVIFLLTLEQDTREVLMITPIWFLVLTIGYHASKKNHKSQL